MMYKTGIYIGRVGFAKLIAIGMISGASLVGSPAAQDLTVIESEWPVSRDSYTGTGSEWIRFISLYCRPLYRFHYGRQQGGEVYKAVLAEPGPTQNKDGLRVTISSDAYFYRITKDRYKGDLKKDSVKVTVNDVITTYRNLINPESELRSTWFRDRLEKRVLDMVAIADDTLWVKFKSGMMPYPPERILDFPIIPAVAVPEQAILLNPPPDSKLDLYYQRPWGSGPYVYGDSVKKATSYGFWFERSRPTTDRRFKSITVRTLPRVNMENELKHPRDDEVCIPSVPIGVRALVSQDYQVQSLYYPNVEQVIFNTRRKHLNDYRVRAALSVFIDRATLVKGYSGEADVVTGPFPKGYWFYCDDCDLPYASYNPAFGKILLRQAGWEFDEFKGKWYKDGKTLKIKIIGQSGSEGSIVSMMVRQIADGWTEFGIEATAETVMPKKYIKLLEKRDFDAAFNVLQYPIVPDIDRHFITGGKENYSGLSEPVVDAYWDSLSTVSTAQIKLYWHKLHEQIATAVPSAFLWTPQNYAVHSKWIAVRSNYFPHNFLGLIENWEIEPY